MKIALVSQVDPTPDKGGGKAQYYLAQEWTKLGHKVTLIGPTLLSGFTNSHQGGEEQEIAQQGFEHFINNEGGAYDIIDFDHNYKLPSRSSLNNTLLVARSVLFRVHSINIRHQESPKLKHRISRLIRKFVRSAPNRAQEITDLRGQLLRADLINLTSDLDVVAAKNYLRLEDEQLCRYPYALSLDAVEQFKNVEAPLNNDRKRIVFLGTFDFRKGCLDLVQCFRILLKSSPDLELTLLGAKGIHTTEKEVRSLFNSRENKQLNVVMNFEPTELHLHLTKFHAAVFPSYFEGFPFSVQETLCSGIPTVAYDSPGAHDLLPEDWLVKSGDFRTLAKTLEPLISNLDHAKRIRAKSLVEFYKWPEIAEATISLYTNRLQQKRTNQPTTET